MPISRRNFLSGAAAAGAGFGLGALSHQFPLPSPRVGPDWRPGEEATVTSTCLLCPAHCGIRGRLVDGDLCRIDGNPLHPVSRGGLCPKGQAGIQLYYHPGRLTGPLQRTGPRGSGEFAPISWDEALDRLAGALREARAEGRASSVQWATGHLTGVMSDLIAGFCTAWGTEQIGVDDYRDGSSEVMRLCQGIDAPPAFDLESADLVLSFGAGLSEAWWSLPQAAGARAARVGQAPRWIQIDTRLSRSAVSADEWHPLRPGTYGALALGLAYFILKEGRYDTEAVSRQVSGWEDWTDEEGRQHLGFRRLALRHGRPDYVSARTGISLQRLVALAKAFGEAQRPVALWDHAVSWRRGGLADALAIHALNIMAGSLNRPGGVLVQAPMPAAATLRNPRLQRSPDVTSLLSRDPADTPAVLLLCQSNPAASMPDPGIAIQALTRASLVVSFSPFLDESARQADLVLPDHSYLERWQDAPAPATVPFPVWGVVRPMTAPRYNTRATGDVILQLARRLGGDLQSWARWDTTEDMVRERGLALAGSQRGSAFVDEFRHREIREMERRGWWIPHGKPPESYWEEVVESGGWFDPFYDYHDRSARSQRPDGRVWIFPPEARKALAQGNEDLAEGFLPRSREKALEDGPEADGSVVLLPFRVSTLTSGSTPLMPWLMENIGVLTGNAWESWAEMHPDTARDLGLRNGQRVRVESPSGGFETVLRVFPGAQPGVLNTPYGLHTRVPGWGIGHGSNPLAAVGHTTDQVSGLPDWYSTRVRVVPA